MLAISVSVKVRPSTDSQDLEMLAEHNPAPVSPSIIKGTVEPDWIYMRMVPLDMP